MYIVPNVNIIHGANELASILIRRNFYTRFELIRYFRNKDACSQRTKIARIKPGVRNSQHRINCVNEIPLSLSVFLLRSFPRFNPPPPVTTFIADRVLKCALFPMLSVHSGRNFHRSSFQFFVSNRDKCFKYEINAEESLVAGTLLKIFFLLFSSFLFLLFFPFLSPFLLIRETIHT